MRSRRRFLGATAASGALLGLGDFGFLSCLRPVSADEVNPQPDMVRLQPDIEPLVRLLEETPRERLLEEVATRIDAGLSYRELLAALQLAGVRNIQPRPSVGFKFHGVLVVNSAHLASLASSDADRWLPMFWALDYFKKTQADDEREGNWTMAAVDESRVPGPGDARKELAAALDAWDHERADWATAGFVRATGANEVFEFFARYGARDFRSIGHKAIFVANSWRTLQTIGWQHAEPIIRSLAYAITQYDGPNPASSDELADRPWRLNQELAAQLRADWMAGESRAEATKEVLATLRESPYDVACRKVVEVMNSGAAPSCAWDAIFGCAGELLMRKPGIVALHAVTSANALHYASTASGDDLTRRLMLLQAVAFVTLFRDEVVRRGGEMADLHLEALEPVAPAESDQEAIAAIFQDVSGNRPAAAARVLGYLQAGRSPEDLIAAARRMIFLKGRDSHDYKFSSAVLEDFYNVTPAWRNQFLATAVFNLKGTGDADNSLVARTRAALNA